MAFYTALDERELDTFRLGFNIEPVASYTGASDGIENTTYFLTAGSRRFVLTLFEDISMSELPFFIGLMQWLDQCGLPVACPLQDSSGVTLHVLSGKPALLFPCLPGRHPSPVTLAQCIAVGTCLGRMHASTQAYPEQKPNSRSTAWMEGARSQLRDLLCDEDIALLDSQIHNSQWLRLQAGLPVGVIHGDLFHDNALFEGEHLTGIIDFYNACTDVLLLDLAIVVNDWCVEPSGGLNGHLMAALVAAYQGERPLEEKEKQSWQQVLQLAASRFWLSRLLAEKLPSKHGVVHSHKPSAEYRARLIHHAEHKYCIVDN